MHRDARNFFPHPEGFWPERWLFAASRAPNTDTDTNMAPPAGFTHAEGAFAPFSHGPMNCVGKNLALREIRAVVCAIVQRFRVVPGEGKGALVFGLREYEEAFRDYYVTEKGPVRVKLEVRAGVGCAA